MRHASLIQLILCEVCLLFPACNALRLSHTRWKMQPPQVQRRAPVLMRAPAVVVGGGMAGLCTALELAQRGWEVKVLSRSCSEAATLTAGGMLAPQSERIGTEGRDGSLLKLALEARDYFPQWAARLESTAQMPTGLRAVGGFISPAFADDSVHRWKPPEAAGEAIWLSSEEVHSMEPLLSDEVCGGWWYPQDMSVDPRATHAALLAACTAAGVELREGAEASALVLSSDGATVRAIRLADGSLIDVGVAVLCGGSWLRELLPVPIHPIKGQMLALRPTSAAEHQIGLERVLFGDRCYIIPRPGGRIVVGATEEPEAGYCTAPTALGVHALLSRAIATVPALAHYALDEVWAGLRPTTPDRLPIIGPTPWANVQLAAGYHRNGILLGPLCAKLIVDRMCGTISPHAEALLAPCLWSRFLPKGTAARPSLPSSSAPSFQGVATVKEMLRPVNGATSPSSAASTPLPGRPEGDIGPSVLEALRKNRQFLERLEEENLDIEGSASSDDEPPAAVEQSTPSTPEQQPDTDEPLLWRINDDGSEVPIYRGQPPAELLQGYGDTMLDIPPTKFARDRDAANELHDAKQEAGTIRDALRKNREFLQRLGEDADLEVVQLASEKDLPPAPTAPSTSERSDADEPLLWRIDDDGNEVPIYRGQPPPELLQGYGDTMLATPPNTKASSPPLTSTGGVERTLNSDTTKTGEIHELHSVDAYDVISADKTPGSDSAIWRATLSNRGLADKLDVDDSELQALIEADLREFNRSQ
ncbi:hypothetical protein AB1Y20_021284 [Prymnesium parvum]|uniref:FAD dependent oxidoreductase domain-containing protein n=1 Tax=Prymnesium parvum TaxID=97485 RepID=A0AB34JLK5_PRYPA